LLDQITDGQRLICRHERADQSNQEFIHIVKLTIFAPESKANSVESTWNG
jgi:hypothetical protein